MPVMDSANKIGMTAKNHGKVKGGASWELKDQPCIATKLLPTTVTSIT